MNVTLRPGYLARHVTLQARHAFPSGAAIVAVDDNGTFHSVAAPPFTTLEAAQAYIDALPARIWATAPDRRPSAYVTPTHGGGYALQPVR